MLLCFLSRLFLDFRCSNLILNHFLKRIISEVVLKLKIKVDKINFLKNFRAWELIKCLVYQGNSYFYFSKETTDRGQEVWVQKL